MCVFNVLLEKIIFHCHNMHVCDLCGSHDYRHSSKKEVCAQLNALDMANFESFPKSIKLSGNFLILKSAGVEEQFYLGEARLMGKMKFS